MQQTDDLPAPLCPSPRFFTPYFPRARAPANSQSSAAQVFFSVIVKKKKINEDANIIKRSVAFNFVYESVEKNGIRCKNKERRTVGTCVTYCGGKVGFAGRVSGR